MYFLSKRRFGTLVNTVHFLGKNTLVLGKYGKCSSLLVNTKLFLCCFGKSTLTKVDVDFKTTQPIF
jgi:hypothetical protein